MADGSTDLGSAVSAARRLRGLILAAAQRHGLSEVRIVVSAPVTWQGEAPIQLLVRPADGRADLGLFAFAEDVEELAGRPVQVATGHQPVVEAEQL